MVSRMTLDPDGLLAAAVIDAAYRLSYGRPGSLLLFCEANPHGFAEPVFVHVTANQFAILELIHDDA